MSTYYYNANAPAKNDLIRDIPVIAVHAGEAVGSQWQSNQVQDAGGFQSITWIVNPQVPVHIAVPRPIAQQYFQPGKTYEKLSVYAFRPMPGASWQSDGGYMVGATIALVFKPVMVQTVSPIMQWKGLPPMPQVQRNYLEKKFGRDAYVPVDVKFFAQQADIFE
jgi:hypothetical protein